MPSPSPWPPSGLRVSRRRSAAGRIELPATADHRLSLHLSASTRTACLESGEWFLRVRGDVDLTPANDTGGFDAEEGSLWLDVHIPSGFLQRVAEEMALPPAHAGLGTGHLIRNTRLTHLALALDAEQDDDRPRDRLYLDSLGVALAVELLARHRAPLPSPRGLSPQQVQHVIDFIEAHLDTDLSLDRLAKVAGVSSSHLQRGFKLNLGVPVHRYVVRRRVERAHALLVRGSMPASQIAFEAGFAHQGHMARWMRRLLGATPRELLRQR